jgi:hypothetical protein
MSAPGKPGNPDDPEDGGHEGPIGVPPNMQGRQVKVVISPQAQDVLFADIFGFTLGPSHGIIRFGVLQPETGEFVVHTQIALTPQGMMALSDGLKKNIENIRKMKPGPKTTMN